MFNLFKKSIDKNVYAPVNGKIIKLEDVPDQVFATKMMGDGVAFEFDGDTIYAPCDGKITVIADTKHALGMKCDNSAEILIHIGLDTVNLKGCGFDMKVKVGSKVKRGDPLVVLDRNYFKEKNMNLITPLILTNYKELNYKILDVNKEVDKNTIVIDIE